MSKNLRGLSERKGLEDNLFDTIRRVSSVESEEKDALLNAISEKYLIGKSTVLGTTTFYDFLNSEHKRRKVFICDGTACLTSGKQDKLREALLEKFKEEEIGTVTCLGLCHTNNSFMYENRAYSLYDLTSLNEVLKSHNYPKSPFYTGSNATVPVLRREINNLAQYYDKIKKYGDNISGALNEIKISALRGRGGAGFPFHIKLYEAAKAVSKKKFIVCNADEGDPGAFSDKWLLEERPHSVLSGMIISGLITGADTGIVYIRGEYPESIRSVKKAIEQLEREKLTNFNVSGKDFNFSFYVVEGAGAYICGEETSLLNSIEGLRPEVRTRPPFPVRYGLYGKPTVLSNVETFANISYILNEGGITFSELGTEKSTGTKLVSLDGSFLKPGIFEVKMGTPFSEVLNELGGGTKYPVKAFQVGGPLGGIIPSSMIEDLNLDFESFREAGFLLGHAGVVSIPDEFPMIKFLLHLFEFTSKESCGKCFPCRIGAQRGYELLKRAIEGNEKIERDLFTDLLDTMELGSLCALGGGLPLPVKNALYYFGAELDGYFK